MVEALNTALDKIEDSLPELPRKVMHIQRSIIDATFEAATLVYHQVAGAVSPLVSTMSTGKNTIAGQARAETAQLENAVMTGARTVVGQARAQGEQIEKAVVTGARTVVGQARAAAEKVEETATVSARTVSGQAKAQVSKVVEQANDTLDELVERAEEDVEALREATLHQMTKAELYERAQELDIEGRSRMSKDELIEAITDQ